MENNRENYINVRNNLSETMNDIINKIKEVDDEFYELKKEIEELEIKQKDLFEKHFTFRVTLKAISRLTTEYAIINENITDLLRIANTLADENAVSKIISSAIDSLFKKKDIINDIINHLNSLQKLHNEIYKAELKNKEDNIEEDITEITDFGSIE